MGSDCVSSCSLLIFLHCVIVWFLVCCVFLFLFTVLVPEQRKAVNEQVHEMIIIVIIIIMVRK